jgi:starch synthase
LPADLDKPIFANITRLTAQKGIDLMMANNRGRNLATGAYIMSLGSGESRYEDFWQRLRDYAPRQVGVFRGYNEDLAHLIEAGADVFYDAVEVRAVRLESNVFSLRYGTVPIVRAVGGLDDTVENFDRVNGSGNGLNSPNFAPINFVEKIYEALFAYHDREVWRRLQAQRNDG